MKSQAHGNGKVSLAERVAKLEAEVERLKAEANQPRGWRAIVGCMRDNPLFEEVVEHIKQQRQQDYAQARREMKGQPKKAKRPRRAVPATR